MARKKILTITIPNETKTRLDGLRAQFLERHGIQPTTSAIVNFALREMEDKYFLANFRG